MPLSLLQKAVHNIQINEQTFSVANSVILKLPIFNQMSPKKLPSRWNQKSPKKLPPWNQKSPNTRHFISKVTQSRDKKKLLKYDEMLRMC